MDGNRARRAGGEGPGADAGRGTGLFGAEGVRSVWRRGDSDTWTLGHGAMEKWGSEELEKNSGEAQRTERGTTQNVDRAGARNKGHEHVRSFEFVVSSELVDSSHRTRTTEREPGLERNCSPWTNDERHNSGYSETSNLS